jgi:hypothetical protein
MAIIVFLATLRGWTDLRGAGNNQYPPDYIVLVSCVRKQRQGRPA